MYKYEKAEPPGIPRGSDSPAGSTTCHGRRCSASGPRCGRSDPACALVAAARVASLSALGRCGRPEGPRSRTDPMRGRVALASSACSSRGSSSRAVYAARHRGPRSGHRGAFFVLRGQGRSHLERSQARYHKMLCRTGRTRPLLPLDVVPATDGCIDGSARWPGPQWGYREADCTGQPSDQRSDHWQLNPACGRHLRRHPRPATTLPPWALMSVGTYVAPGPHRRDPDGRIEILGHNCPY